MARRRGELSKRQHSPILVASMRLLLTATRAVNAKVGTDGFNAVWTSPETLPLPDEIQNPSAWVRRVHG
jgi:hypothetical protein